MVKILDRIFKSKDNILTVMKTIKILIENQCLKLSKKVIRIHLVFCLHKNLLKYKTNLIQCIIYFIYNESI